MFEYILIFALGFFIGYGTGDINKAEQEDKHIKAQKMIIEKIREDRQRG